MIQFECQVVIQYELSPVKYGTYNHFVVNCSYGTREYCICRQVKVNVSTRNSGNHGNTVTSEFRCSF